MPVQTTTNFYRARRRAQIHASARGSPEVTTEDLLYGIAVVEGVGCFLIEGLGVPLSRLTRQVSALSPNLTGGDGLLPVGQVGETDLTLFCGRKAPRPTAAVEAVVQFALEEATRTGRAYCGSEHLAIGLLRHGQSKAARVLARRGATLEAARVKLAEMMKG